MMQTETSVTADARVSVPRALKNGSALVALSSVIWGLGCFVRKQFAKGALLLAAEVGIILYMISSGFYNLTKLITLGDVEQQKVWNEAKSIFEYVDGDRSLVILLYGIVTVAVLLCGVLLLRLSVKSAYQAEQLAKTGKPVPGFRDDMTRLFDRDLHKPLLTLPILGVLVFTVLPLVFMTSMAFTNYSVLDNKLVLFDWVGLKNFRRMVDLQGSLGQTFWSVLGWTVAWAVIATFSNYILGMLLSLFINWKEIRGKKFWRFCFVLTVAVPHFVTLLIIRQMLQPNGAVNVLLQITGILQNIPAELYESARVDGASPVVTFFKITLPYMLFVTTPYLITSFTGNINNFNVIFLTSKGMPRAVESTAGTTDLLITWLYKLTIDNQYFDVGAVIGIMTFVTLSVVSLLTFHYSGSNRNEEGFR